MRPARPAPSVAGVTRRTRPEIDLAPRKRPRRGLIVALAVLAAAAVPATRATAQGSEPLLGICDFPITHDFPQDRSKGHEVRAAASPYEFIVTGQTVVVVTNVENGKSVRVNSNAALFFADGGREMYARGQLVSFFSSPRGDIPKGVWLATGSMHATLDEHGRVVTVTGGVLKRDICAELAS